MTGSISQSTQPPSPPILDIPNRQGAPIVPMSNADPQVIFKPNNQEVVYKQNIMVRWLQPPTPPPPAPIVIRGKTCIMMTKINHNSFYNRSSTSPRNSTTNYMSTNASMSKNTTTDYYQVLTKIYFSLMKIEFLKRKTATVPLTWTTFNY